MYVCDRRFWDWKEKPKRLWERSADIRVIVGAEQPLWENVLVAEDTTEVSVSAGQSEFAYGSR